MPGSVRRALQAAPRQTSLCCQASGRASAEITPASATISLGPDRRTQQLRGLPLQGIEQAVQRCHFVVVQQRKNSAVDGRHSWQHARMQCAALVGEGDVGQAAVARDRTPFDQALGLQAGQRTRCARPVQFGAYGQVRRLQRAGFAQNGERLSGAAQRWPSARALTRQISVDGPNRRWCDGVRGCWAM